jgi:hypothetical protein
MNFVNQLGNNESNVNWNIYNFDWVLSYWVPTRKNSHTRVGSEIGMGGAGPNQMMKYDLAQGHQLYKWLQVYKNEFVSLNFN